MYDLQLRKGGVLVFQEWDTEVSEFVEEEVEYCDFAFHFSDTICLAAGITLRDVFLLISKDIATFSVFTGCSFLDEITKEALSEPIIDSSPMGILELKRIAVVHESNLCFYFDFRGISSNDTYGIEFTPVNKLVAYPLVLNEQLCIEDSESEEAYLKCHMQFTLGDLIIGVIEELSFMGPPEVRGMAFEELKKRAEDIKDDKIETTSWEKIREELEAQIEEDKIPCKVCGEDARMQCFDKPPGICIACFERMKEN